MEITGELKDTLEKLSKVNIDFIEFKKKNPDCFKSISFKRLETTQYTFKLQSWPTFINRQTKATFHELGSKLFALIKSIPARLFNNNPKQIAAYFDQSEIVVSSLLEGISDEQLANMVGRVDFTFSTAGLKCLEFNVTVGNAGWALPEWESLHLSIPIFAKFLKEYHVKINNENYLELFLQHIVRFSAHLASPPGYAGNVANVGNLELNAAVAMQGYNEDLVSRNPFQKDLKEIYKKILTRNALTGNIFMCDFPRLDVHDNKVYYGGNRIHGLIELYHGLLIPGIEQAYTSGNVRIVNGPATGLLSNKLNLALLSENEDSNVFSPEEKETIKKYIPWTRKIIPGETVYKGQKVQLENFLMANKDKLVIKPPLGLGGQRVCIGQAVFFREWEHLVNTALQKKNYLVQELVEAPRFLFQAGEDGCAYHDIIWGAWILGSQYGAAFVRARPSGTTRKVVNAGQGAEISVVFEVDE